MSFTLNGADMGVAFTDVPAEGYYPAASLARNQQCKFNFGVQPMRWIIILVIV